MSTTAYKNKRAGRVLTEQAPISRGMNFTHQEVPAGYAKLLVNYNLKDNGAALVPREAYISDYENEGKLVIDEFVDDSTPALGKAHFAGLLYMEEADESLQLGDVVLSVGNVASYELGPHVMQPVAGYDDGYAAALKARLDFAISGTHLSQTLKFNRLGWAYIKDNNGERRIGYLDPTTIGMFRAKMINTPVYGTDVGITEPVPKHVPAIAVLQHALYGVVTPSRPERTNTSVNGVYSNYFITNPFKLCRLNLKKVATHPDAAPVTLTWNGNCHASADENYGYSISLDNFLAYQGQDEAYWAGLVGRIFTYVENGVTKTNQLLGFTQSTDGTPDLMFGETFKTATNAYADYGFNTMTYLGGLDQMTAHKHAVITAEPVVIKEPSLSEAMAVGFNMLSGTPFVFNNVMGATELKGIIGYEPGTPFGRILFSANPGETIRFNLVYSYETGQSYKVKWEYLPQGKDTWTVLKDFGAVVPVGVEEYIYQDVTPLDTTFTIRATLRKNDLVASDRVMLAPYTLGKNDVKNLADDNFDLTTATGMFSHADRIGLYGVQGAENTIFYSDVGNPGYFPFPNNIDWVEGEILKVLNYLDYLLIVTAKSLYITVGKGDISTFVTKQILNNLDITAADAENIKVIKDQLFFKSSNTYYVLKPNSYSSDGSDLRNYEISSAIDSFLSNLNTNVSNLLNKMYKINTVPADVIFRGESTQVLDGQLHVMYNMGYLDNDLFPNFTLDLVYDPLKRNWLIHLYIIPGVDSLQYHFREEGDVLTYFHHTKHTEDVGAYKHELVPVSQKANSRVYSDRCSNYWPGAYKTNVQMLDTGISPLNNSVYKRLRELQFTVSNGSGQALHFFTDVYADGFNVLDSVSWTVEQITDPEDPDFGRIFIHSEEIPTVAGETILNSWELDMSHFPSDTLIRTHVELAGKGRFLSATLVNEDELHYELSSIYWAYRVLDSR